jgi:hypothetical protein
MEGYSAFISDGLAFSIWRSPLSSIYIVRIWIRLKSFMFLKTNDRNKKYNFLTHTWRLNVFKIFLQKTLLLKPAIILMIFLLDVKYLLAIS